MPLFSMHAIFCIRVRRLMAIREKNGDMLSLTPASFVSLTSFPLKCLIGAEVLGSRAATACFYIDFFFKFL